MPTPFRKILSLVPTTYHIGFAYFEDDQLVDWGTKILGNQPIIERLTSSGFQTVTQLLERFEPSVVLLPEPTVSKRRGYRNRYLRALHALIDRPEVPVIRCDEKLIRRYFQNTLQLDRPNKWAIMGYLGTRFPALQPSVPQVRRGWKSQDYSWLMFQAVGMTVAWLNTQT